MKKEDMDSRSFGYKNILRRLFLIDDELRAKKKVTLEELVQKVKYGLENQENFVEKKIDLEDPDGIPVTRYRHQLHSKDFAPHTRTIQRDLVFMKEELNAPIQREGHYYSYSDSFYQLPFFYMTDNEIQTLFLAEKILQEYSQAPFLRTVRSAFDKIRYYIKSEKTLSSLIKELPITFLANGNQPIRPEIWDKILECIQQHKEIKIKYGESNEEPSDKMVTVHPYHIIGATGEFYLIAYSLENKAFQRYQFSGIKKTSMPGIHFKTRDDFDLTAIIKNNF